MTTAHADPSTQASPTRLDERTLLAAVAAGDRAAAGELVDRTYGRVFATLVRLSSDRELAADLTQETYRRAWAGLPSFDGRAKVSTWLHRIAYTTFLNHVRRPRQLLPLEDAPRAAVTDPEPDGDQRLLDAERRERLRRAVLQLPETLRATVAARYWAEVPVREIAALEGISQVGVRKRLRKAIRMLSDALGEVTP